MTDQALVHSVAVIKDVLKDTAERDTATAVAVLARTRSMCKKFY